MSFGAPTPPDPTATSNTQQQFNTTAGTTQNQINSYNQSNPFGNVNYAADPSSPSGYRVQTNLSQPNQNLLDTQFGSQAVAGQTAQSLLKNTAGMYGSAPNFQAFDPTSMVSQLNSWQQKYQQPLFDQQSSNLEAQLRNQGLTPGTEAYNNAKNLLARNQGDVTNQFMTNNIGTGLQAQQQKFGQDVTNYQLPLQTEAALTGYASPTAPTFQQTPTAQIQPANYQGAVQSNYTNQMQNYENTWNNIGKLGTAGIGLAMAPASSLAGGWGSSLAGMFGGGPSWGANNPGANGSAYFGPVAP